MSAEFLVVGGVRASDSFPFSERATLGTDPGCEVRLAGAGVAPLHAVVVRRPEGGYRLTVVDGANEVIVNGVARREARLYHGQRVLVGTIELQFLCVADKDPADTSADFGAQAGAKPGEREEPSSDSKVERVWKSSHFTKGDIDLETFARLDAAERALRGLYLVGLGATEERSLTRILERSADAVQAALLPDRLILALYEPENDSFVSAVVRRGQYDCKGARLPVSKRVVRKGAVDGVSTMTHARHEGEPGDRPILCTPLTTGGKAVGAFYLERLPNAKRFDDDDLDFLAAVGRIVGLAIERSRFEVDAKSRAAETDRERSRWLAVVHGLRSGVLIVDGEGTVELANPSARKILSEHLGIEDPQQLKELGGVPLQHIVAQASYDEALEVVIPGDPEVVLEVRPSPVLEPDGARAGAALIISDATEERLRRAKLVQAEKLSTLGEMLAGVAHELNNPLATILGYAEILSRKAPPAEKPGLAAILEEAERCRRIVSSLLAFARARKSERAPLDAGAVAASVLDLLAHELRSGQVEVVRTLPPLPLVSAERYELQQVFFNLVRNAIDAVKGSSSPGKIELVASTTTTVSGEERVRVEVRDSGPGFPKESHGELTPRPFFTTKGEGTGLGLSIAHGIVRELGGTIEAGTAPGGGAAVAVELPVAPRSADPATPAPAPAAAPAKSAGSAVASAPTPAAPGEPIGKRPRRGKRILVVDDEDHVRALLSDFVRDQGHVPVPARDGQEALAHIAANPYLDAVLSDIRMPNMDGGQLLHELRRRGHPLADRLVFLSGDLARPETQALVLESGRPVLPKPFRLAQVCRALEDVLGKEL